MAGFIGPEGSNCATEAMVAGSKNKAMISYRCSDAEITSQEKFPTFTRMEPPDTQVRTLIQGPKSKSILLKLYFQVTNSVLSLLKYYKWFKFSIISQDDSQWETIAKHLYDQAEERNFTVNHYLKFQDPQECCINQKQECCTDVS